MSREFLLPDLGEGLTEAEIVAWLVAPGDTIVIDQAVVEVESAKSIVELPSPYGGVVASLFGEPGQVIHAGQVLLTVADAVTDVSAAGATVGVPVAAAPNSTLSEGSGAVLVGYGTTESTRPPRTVAAGRFGTVTTADAAARLKAPTPTPIPAAVEPVRIDAARRSPVVSPIVRRLARENGFDASMLAGSGQNDLVLRSDVEDHIRALTTSALTTSEPPTSAPPVLVVAATGAAASATPAGRDDVSADIRIPISGLRKVVAQRLTTSRREIPEATIWLDVDATALFAARDQLLTATGERFSVTALIARFVVAGLRQFPVLNSSVDTASQEILQHGAVNLGIAAQTSRGLMVPVIHGAHAMSTRQLRDAIAALVAQSPDGTFAPSALTGGTFTLNNFGSLGVDGSAAIINHPEAAILGIGRMIERPWVIDHALAVRTVVELSMVFDHRVCDGGTAAGFLTYVARCIENPVSLLADL
ncbi:pyruvate dehydrogenase E2 component (dihydrolipoamide acetyltransferase) [Cryobacterium flavum]|uniref:Dihydrolipoamide acetyltransferase component of pyruvate dehydrogenase complex n=1 Tax=Cryobacterium flavum TaxID=1424659 RepID=A0A4R8UY70_9MICO|nr:MULTISPECIES: dihydrolipoamide acetyltransferase family protein [Cryobacterium]TFB74500.1 2-oxo acid dehydrogenase subunit E2 [Cryobacterium flavum]SDN18632.1 pyruvate dehydrogenase E2 component (dihydrolipoamide acetyltransferase) [Cryobacterium flavum]